MNTRPRKRMDEDSEVALSVVEEERLADKSRADQQADRERRIAECHEVMGRIQGFKLVAEFADVGSLVWLKQIKETKAYRDLPGVGTWEKFCERVGLSRSKVDEDLSNIAAFGEKFLADVGDFGLGYRDLRKLRHLTHDGTVAIEGDLVVIGDESIPLSSDYREDLQSALERIIAAKDDLLREKDATIRAKDKVLQSKADLIKRQEKDLARYEDEAHKKGLTPTEDAFLHKMDTLRTGFDGYMLRIDPERCSEMCGRDADAPTPRMVSAYLTTLDYMRKQLLAAYDTAQDMYGSAIMTPEEAWTQPEE